MLILLDSLLQERGCQATFSSWEMLSLTSVLIPLRATLTSTAGSRTAGPSSSPTLLTTPPSAPPSWAGCRLSATSLARGVSSSSLYHVTRWSPTTGGSRTSSPTTTCPPGSPTPSSLTPSAMLQNCTVRWTLTRRMPKVSPLLAGPCSLSD